MLVVDLASSSEEVSDYIYQSIGNDSDSQLTGDQNIDPVPVETYPTLPSSLDDFIKDPVYDDERLLAGLKSFLEDGPRPLNRVPLSNEDPFLPCVEDA